MPLYEYQCIECNEQVEVIQKFSDKPLTNCSFCNKETLERMPSKSAFHLKGGGWYKDGYHDPKNDNSKKTDPSNSKKEADKKNSSKKNETSKIDSSATKKTSETKVSK